jgi:chromosome partitioning protein
MITLALVSQKGGSGKTTLATHMAAAAVQAGYITCLIDLDPQATAAAWGDWRTESGATDPEVIVTPPARLARTLEDARKAGAQVVVVDTPPNADVAAREAVKAADLVLIPCRPRTFDLHAIETTAGLAVGSGKPAFVVINMAPPRAPALFSEASSVVQGYGLEVAPVMIVDRAAIHHSAAAGKTALETEPNGKATEEMTSLWKFVCNHVIMPSQNHDHTESAA